MQQTSHTEQFKYTVAKSETATREAILAVFAEQNLVGDVLDDNDSTLSWEGHYTFTPVDDGVDIKNRTLDAAFALWGLSHEPVTVRFSGSGFETRTFIVRGDTLDQIEGPMELPVCPGCGKHHPELPPELQKLQQLLDVLQGIQGIPPKDDDKLPQGSYISPMRGRQDN